MTSSITDDRTVYAVAADTLGGLVDVVVESEKMAAMIAAMRAEQIDQCRRFAEVSVRVTTSDGMAPWSQAETAWRTLISELACALKLPERTVNALVEESEMLVHELRATLAGLQHGDFSYRHAKVIIDQARSLPKHQRASFEEEILPHAADLTVARFEQKARTAREHLDPSTIAERHAKSMLDRTVLIENAQDGMAWLHHFMPAADARAAYNHITDVAIAMQGAGETRTLTQLRADAATDLLLDGEVAGRSEFRIRPWVAITVPALSLLGRCDEPATLEGYGPIDLDTARRLVAGAPSFLRVLTHPETGATLSVGRDRYAVPADLKSWLRVRDGTCRKPGCNRPAIRCDLDHTRERQHDGPTSHDNLAHLCPKHHAEKHHTGWDLKHIGDGVIEWTSPTGHTYFSEPATRIRPAPPFGSGEGSRQGP
jgi:hypothetical protein